MFGKKEIKMTCPYRNIFGCNCNYHDASLCPEFHKYADAGHDIEINDNDHDKRRFHIESTLIGMVGSP